MAITREEALSADMFHYRAAHNARCVRWRRNGVTKTWKREPNRVSVPVKYGLYRYDHIINITDPNLHTEANCPFAGR